MAKTTKAVKATRKPRTPKEIVIPAGLEAEAKKQMGNEEISTCEAIRNVSKKFGKHRAAVVKVLTAKPFNVPKGTAQTQFQLSRAE